MFLSGVIGSAKLFITLFGFLTTLIGPEVTWIFEILTLIFSTMAWGGGITVIVGAIFVALNRFGMGKFIIGIGAGMGLIGLIIFLITAAVGGSLINDIMGIVIDILNGSYGFLGVLLTIFARIRLKKDKED